MQKLHTPFIVMCGETLPEFAGLLPRLGQQLHGVILY